jgi:CO dehydrogenase maturation factor
LVDELELVVKRQSVIINFVPNGIDPHLSEELTRLSIEPVTIIPLDEEVYQYDLNLKSLLDLPDTSKAVMAVSDLMTGLLKEGNLVTKK